MKAPAPGLVFTTDEELVRRLQGALEGRMTVRAAAGSADALRRLETMGEGVVWVDLCSDGALPLLAHVARAHPSDVPVAIGDPRGDLAREAAILGAFSVEPRDFDIHAMQQTVRHALERIELRREIARLRAAAVEGPAAPPIFERLPEPSLRHFIRSLRNLDGVEALLRDAVQSVGLAMGVSRAGVFMPDASGVYRLQAELRCLPETLDLAYADFDPLVRWLERHAQMVARGGIERVEETEARPIFKAALEAMGAEILCPLQARGRLIGWLFLGRRSIGLPFREDDLYDLAAMSDHVALALENARLFQNLAEQSALAATMLETMSSGVIAADADGVVRWMNRAAGEILGLDPTRVVGQPATALGSRIYDRLAAAMDGETSEPPADWVEPRTRRAVSVVARRLEGAGGRPGAVAFIEDVTTQRKLREKEEQLNRAAFWADLAAGLSHEIRNPLVAIKTFAQLLPERYADAEFRGQFSELVTHEVGRLEAIIEQINRFAAPPALACRRVAPSTIVASAIERSARRTPPGPVRVDTLARDAPDIHADPEALTEAVACLVDNAVEALAGRGHPRVEVEARRVAGRDGGAEVMITVRDNGPGIPPNILDKVFSPFTTTKTRGMGLGLPIVRRIVADHGGRVRIESSEGGTAVALYLPVEADEKT